MGLFKKPAGNLADEVDVLRQEVSDLRQCCADNAQNWDKANSLLRSMRGDVDLQWEKVNRALSRLAKRDAVEGKSGNGEPTDLNERIRRGDPI